MVTNINRKLQSSRQLSVSRTFGRKNFHLEWLYASILLGIIKVSTSALEHNSKIRGISQNIFTIFAGVFLYLLDHGSLELNSNDAI